MLIRNTEWAAAFLEDVGQYAYMHRNTIEQHMRPVRMRLPASFSRLASSGQQLPSHPPVHGYRVSDQSILHRFRSMRLCDRARQLWC